MSPAQCALCAPHSLVIKRCWGSTSLSDLFSLPYKVQFWQFFFFPPKSGRSLVLILVVFDSDGHSWTYLVWTGLSGLLRSYWIHLANSLVMSSWLEEDCITRFYIKIIILLMCYKLNLKLWSPSKLFCLQPNGHDANFRWAAGFEIQDFF